MKKRVFLIWSACLLVFMPLLTDCDKENGDEPIIVETFEGSEGVVEEQIILELKDMPAIVRDEKHGYVSLCYSEYADEYYIKENISYNISAEVRDALIAVKFEDFNKYNIPLNSKVYVSASITNVARYFDDSVLDDDWFWSTSPVIQRKAYLKDIRIRN